MTQHDHHPHGTPSWVDLMTDDPGKARTFYGSLLGWSFEIGGPETGNYAMGKLRGRQVAGIGGKPPGAQMPSVWTLYFAVDDVDATCRTISEAGGQVTVPPMDVLDHGRMAIAAEPTGGMFGMWQARAHKGMGLMSEPGAYAWSELNTRDTARARDFLGAVFGQRAEKLEGAGIEYVTMHVGEITTGGILQMNEQWPAEVPAHWMVYFTVENTDAACVKVTDLGGRVCVPAFDTPHGRIAVVNDDQGATFSIVQLPSQ